MANLFLALVATGLVIRAAFNSWFHWEYLAWVSVLGFGVMGFGLNRGPDWIVLVGVVILGAGELAVQTGFDRKLGGNRSRGLDEPNGTNFRHRE